MEKLIFDTGIREFEVNGNGYLRFNPSDPNLYNRFLDSVERIREIEKDLEQKAAQSADGNDGEQILRLMRDADFRVKNLLGEVFGGGNDFDKLLGGVNLLAMTRSGNRVITNLINALLPVIEEGAQQYIDDKAEQVKANRAARRGN